MRHLYRHLLIILLSPLVIACMTTTPTPVRPMPTRIHGASSPSPYVTPKLTPRAGEPPLRLQGWIYPGEPACSALLEVQDGRQIDTLKPQYFTLGGDGTLTEFLATDQCNGYSPENVAVLQAHSHRQFVTVSGPDIAGVVALDSQPALLADFSQKLLSFLQMTHFTGVELDVEGAAAWTLAQYNSYKNVVSLFGKMLHANGFQLMIDGPVILSSQEQQWYPSWVWEDFTSLPVDGMVAMCYDQETDNGVGTPLSSFQAIHDCCTWMLVHVKDPSRIVIGINSYGYTGERNTYTAQNLTYEQLRGRPGFSSAQRDPLSGEMMWWQGNTFYDYSDQETLDQKIKVVLSTGLSQVSIWHLGGANPWPSLGSSPTPVPVPAPPPPTDPLVAFTERYPLFDGWYRQTLAGKDGQE